MIRSAIVAAACAVAATGGEAFAQVERNISGSWEVVQLAGGCRAILSDELEMAWGPFSNTTIRWSGGCDENKLITGHGTLTTEFTTGEGTHFRLEKVGDADDGMFVGNVSETTYSNQDDYDDKTPPGSMQLHDGGDVRNPMPGFYKDGCQYFVSDGAPDMSRALFDCQSSQGAALRNQLLGRGRQVATAPPQVAPPPVYTPPPSPPPSLPPAPTPRASAPIPSTLPASPAPSQHGGGVAGRASTILGGSSAPKKPEKPETDPTPVSDCITIDKRNGDSGTLYGGFKNTCPFPIYFTMCNESPAKGSWAESFRCVNSKGKMDLFLDGIAAYGVQAAHISSNGLVYWFACRQPLTPGDTEYRPGKGIFGRCKM